MTVISRPRTGPWTSQPQKSLAAWSTHGQNAAISINLLQSGPAPVGLYEVSLFFVVDTAGTSGTMRMQVACTGAGGNNIYSLPAHDIAVVGAESGIFLIDSLGSAAMTLTVVPALVTTGSLQYSYRAIVNMLDNQA